LEILSVPGAVERRRGKCFFNYLEEQRKEAVSFNKVILARAGPDRRPKKRGKMVLSEKGTAGDRPSANMLTGEQMPQFVKYLVAGDSAAVRQKQGRDRNFQGNMTAAGVVNILNVEKGRNIRFTTTRKSKYDYRTRGVSFGPDGGEGGKAINMHLGS